MNKILFSLVFAVLTLGATAQVKIKDGTVTSGAVPNSQAILELESSNKGVLLPRVALDSTTSPAPLAPMGSSFIQGMTVYNTATAGTAPHNVTPGIYYSDGTQWIRTNWRIPHVADTSLIADKANEDIIFNTGTQVLQYYNTATQSWQSVAVPAMNTAQMDAIQNPLVGQTVFNTDLQCLDTYNGTAWTSLCGSTPNAQFTCSGGVSLNGVYTAGTAVNSSNYLSITLDVTQTGAYSIQGTTTNGYGFSTQGTFVTTGVQTVTVPAQGTPTTDNPAPGDALSLVFNGLTAACNSITIPVSAPAATYSINCGSAQTVGSFAKGTAYTGAGTNNLTVGVTVTSATPTAGNYTISTNTVAGVYFQGSGSWSTPGIYTVTLQPYGTLTSNKPVTFDLTINSADGATSTCTATITPVIPTLNFLSVGSGNYAPYTDGVNLSKMTGQALNFGPNGTVKYQGNGITWINGNTSGFGSRLTGANPPDIVAICYGGDMTPADASALVTYIKAGGVVFLSDPIIDGISGNWTQVLYGLYGSNYLPNGSAYKTEESVSSNAADNLYPLIAPASDPIINGPFGNLAGANWSEDAAGSVFVTAPPGAIVYSNAYSAFGSAPGNAAGAPVPGFASMFRDGTYNFMYGCDGGWLIGTSGAGTQWNGLGYPGWDTGSPFYTPGSRLVYNPTSYGSSSSIPSGLASNYILFCNWLAWAMQQAVTTGINASKY